MTVESPPFADFVPQRRFADAVAISPDGASVAYVSNDGGQYNLRVAPLGGGEHRQVTTFTNESVRAAAWSPDGTTLAFAADRDGDEQYQIYVIDASGGAPRRISTADGRQHDLAVDPFTPDGRRLVFAGNDRDEAVQDLLVVDLASGEVERIESATGELMFAVGASPDGRWLLGGIARSNTDVDAFVVDLTATPLAPRVLTAHDGEQVHAPQHWLPDSSRFLLLTDADREFRALATCSVDGEIAVVADPDWDVDAVAVTDDGTTQVWIVNESGSSVVYAREGEGAARRVPVAVGVLEAVDVTPDGSALVGLFGAGTRPRDLARIDLSTGVIDRLTDSVPPALSRVAPVEPQLVEYQTHDGRQVPGWVYRPAGAGPHPVVLSIHGGPESQELAEYSYSGLYQYLLSRGVGVFAPNVRGSTGYGSSYQKLIHRDWGGAELGDFEHAVRYLGGLDWVDSRRVGVFGGSFGGFAALSCLSRLPELFAAGVSIVGPSNLVTFAGAVPPTWRALMKQWVGDPDTDADFLLSRSPITYADQITAPLMVIQGANDPRVPKAESDQIVEALRRRGVEVRYDVYEDEGHGFTKRSNEIQAVTDVAAFLVSQLQP